MAKVKTDKIETKIATLKSFFNAGGLQIVAEPKRWSYPSPYAPDPNPKDNYYAIYGPPLTLDALQNSGLLSESELRPRVDSKTESKAYLDSDLALAFLKKYPELKTETPNRLFALRNDAQEPTLACFDTGRPIEGDTHADGTKPDKLSYLLLSASDARRFEPALKRLTVDGPRQYITAIHHKREVGEFMILPIRHSMVESIRRANPGLIDLQPDEFDIAQAQGADMATAMLHIIANLKGDTRFEKEPKTKTIHPNARAAREPQPEFEPLTLADFLGKLKPHIQGFRRIEQFNGSFDTTMSVNGSAKLAELIKRQSTQANDLSFTPILQHSKTVAYKINQATYDALNPLINGTTITEHLGQQKFNPNWTQPTNIKYLKPKRDIPPAPTLKSIKTPAEEYDLVSESVYSLRLACNSDGSLEQHWLIAELDSPRRGLVLAEKMSIAPAKVSVLTAENEKPTLIRIPISAAIAESLRDDDAKRETDKSRAKEMRIDSQEAPYDSLEALDAEQRSRAGVTESLPKSAKTPEPTAEPEAATHSEETIRADAEKLLFLNQPAFAAQRAIHVASYVWTVIHENYSDIPGKHADLQTQLRNGRAFLGIKIPKTDAPEFESALKHVGFHGPVDRRLTLVGSAGQDQVYKLSLGKLDALAFEKYLTPEHALENGLGSKLGFSSQTTFQNTLKSHFGVTEKTKEEPTDTYAEAWSQLAKLAQKGDLKYAQVRYDEETIAKALHDLQADLDHLKEVAARAETQTTPDNEKTENPLAALSPAIMRQGAKLYTLKRHHEGRLNALRIQIETMEKEISTFRDWVEAQPRTINGDILVTNLVLPDPGSNIINHLNTLRAQLYKPPGAKEEKKEKGDKKEKNPGVQLFPDPLEHVQKAMADKIIMAGNREVLQPREVILVPVIPQFFDVLRIHAPEIEVAALAPKPLSRARLLQSLRSMFYVEPPAKVEIEKDRSYDAVASVRETLPRRDELLNCRDILRYATLVEGHAHENLAAKTVTRRRDDGRVFARKEVLGERIGEQHAAMFHIRDARDWKRAEILLKRLTAADWLKNRERYGGLIEAPLPDDLQAAINQRDHATRQIECIENDDLLFHLQQVAIGKGTEFSLPHARVAARALCEAVEYDEDAEKIRDLLQTDGDIDDTKLASAHGKLEAIFNELRTRRNEAQERVIQLGIHYKIPETDARMAPEIIADEAPLAYLPGEEHGVALSQLAELMPKLPGDESVSFVVYLGLDDKREPDRQMMAAMQSFRPAPDSAGVRSAKAIEEKYGRTSGNTLDEWFAERGKHFGVSGELA
ncbi:MAG: hypothetical protein ACKVOE_01770 [Rickettsiales bacterium]